MAHYLSLSASQHIFPATEEGEECCFSWLMKDLVLVILGHLSVSDAASAFRVCKSFRRCSQNGALWKKVYENTHGASFVVDKFVNLFHLEVPAISVWSVADSERTVVTHSAPFPQLPYRWLAIAAATAAGAPKSAQQQQPQQAVPAPIAAAPVPAPGMMPAAIHQAVHVAEEEEEAAEEEDAGESEATLPLALHLRDGLGISRGEGGVYCGLWQSGELVLGLYASPQTPPAQEKNDSCCEASRIEYMYGGEMHERRWHGLGVTAFPSGGNYVGDFSAGELHGQGLLCYKEGDEYDGEWVHNVKHGYGVYRWISGNTYLGQWVENRREGKIGELQWANGDKYSGEWLDNRRTGMGVLRWSPSRGGGVYEGEFFDNMLHGHGTFHFRGIRYDGHWEEDRREKEGRLTWSDGDYFVGSWLHGGRKGRGTLYRASTGEALEQDWNEPQDVKYSQVTPQKYPSASAASAVCLASDSRHVFST